jgi:hypothetical protein
MTEQLLGLGRVGMLKFLEGFLILQLLHYTLVHYKFKHYFYVNGSGVDENIKMI